MQIETLSLIPVLGERNITIATGSSCGSCSKSHSLIKEENVIRGPFLIHAIEFNSEPCFQAAVSYFESVSPICAVCISEYQGPVCGCEDGITYDNACDLYAAGRTVRGCDINHRSSVVAGT